MAQAVGRSTVRPQHAIVNCSTRRCRRHGTLTDLLHVQTPTPALFLRPSQSQHLAHPARSPPASSPHTVQAARQPPLRGGTGRPGTLAQPGIDEDVGAGEPGVVHLQPGDVTIAAPASASAAGTGPRQRRAKGGASTAPGPPGCSGGDEGPAGPRGPPSGRAGPPRRPCGCARARGGSWGCVGVQRVQSVSATPRRDGPVPRPPPAAVRSRSEQSGGGRWSNKRSSASTVRCPPHRVDGRLRNSCTSAARARRR